MGSQWSHFEFLLALLADINAALIEKWGVFVLKITNPECYFLF